MHSLADKAPDEMANDWKTLDGGDHRASPTRCKDAGMTFADIAKIKHGQTPEGADPKKLAALAAKLQELSSAKVTKAAKDIAKHAKSTCKVKLGAS